MANHFSTLSITRRDNVDVSTMLRDVTATAIAASTAEAPIAVLNWHRLPAFKAKIDHYAYAPYAAGANEWTIAIEVALSATDPFVQVASATITGDAGSSEIPLSGEQISQVLPNAATSVIRVNATATGAPGALTYGAFLTVD